MFKNMNREEHFSRAKGPVASSSAAGHVAASLRHDAQESPWISMLALVSRPALSLLHRVLPGRARAPALPDGGVSGWPSGESAFLGQLHDVMPAAHHPAQHLAFLHCQHGDSWLTAESLAELGIQNADELSAKQRTSVGYFATARSFLSQVVMNAPLAQESRHEDAGHVLGGRVWSAAAVCSPAKSGGCNGNWWGGFWGAEDHSLSWLSNLSRGKEATGPPRPAQQQHSSGHCVSSESGGTKASVAMPTALFARCRDTGSVPGESAGPCCPHKEDNDGLQTGRTESLSSSSPGLPLEHRLEHSLGLFVGTGAAASCSGEVAVLTPDLDNGYSSLEEEHATCRPTPAVTDAPCEDPGSPTETTEEDGALASVCGSGTQEESGEQRGGDEEEESGAAVDMNREEEEEEEAQDSDVSDSEEEEEEEEEETDAEPPSAATPVCQNKAIAYIMGSPCSDDSDSQSDDPLSEDDDGFDSEGSSDLSDSDDDSDCDEETDESDSEAAAADDEAERLWSSLCRSTDPYSPRNFTASLQSAGPRAVPPPNVSSACSPPSSPLDQPPSPLLSSSPPASSPPAESWDESSASEADDAESQRLWNAFSASADPYSPLNFQGPLRTRAPACPGGAGGGRVRGRKGRVHPPLPPRSRRHSTPPSPSSPPSSSSPASSSPPGPSPEAEERLDSGFSEGLAVAVATATVTIIAAAATGYGPHGFTVKKVSFCEQVEEFYASGGEEEEDRRGPWEELARDRFRFRRRVQETEENIGYVLAPAFRSLAYQRLQLLLRPPHHHHQHHHS